MKKLPQSLDQKLKQAIQSAATEAAPSVDMWISRPTTALVNTEFLEKQNVADGASITDIAVAACHPRVYKPVTKVYVGYVDGGTARVKYATSKIEMKDHVWFDTGFSMPATAIALEFDGTMPKNKKGKVEFVTEELPWVFWINGGVVYGQIIGTGSTVTLATANATDVFAVRGVHSEVGGFDFGLVLFMVIAGQLYYRQLIDGVWMDAEIVSLVGGLSLSALTITSIAAMRTWDYRLVVQIRVTNGEMYELVTQYMGIGKQNVEHLEITDVKATGDLVGITYHNTKEYEHIEISSITAGALYGGLYSVATPAIVSAHNISVEVEVEGETIEDWGKVLIAKFNVHLVTADISAHSTQFVLRDANNVQYTATGAALGDDGKTVTLTFADFNAAAGECQITYTPGTAYSMANVEIPSTAYSFTPINLNAPDVDAPEFLEAWNE